MGCNQNGGWLEGRKISLNIWSITDDRYVIYFSILWGVNILTQFRERKRKWTMKYHWDVSVYPLSNKFKRNNKSILEGRRDVHLLVYNLLRLFHASSKLFTDFFSDKLHIYYDVLKFRQLTALSLLRCRRHTKTAD